MDALEIHVAEILSIKKIILKKVRVCGLCLYFLFGLTKNMSIMLCVLRQKTSPKMVKTMDKRRA